MLLLNDSTIVELYQRYINISNENELNNFFDMMIHNNNFEELYTIVLLTYSIKFDTSKISCIINILEEKYLKENISSLALPLFILHAQVGNKSIARYYYNTFMNTSADFEDDRLFNIVQSITEKSLEETSNLSNTKFYEYDKKLEYCYNNTSKKYSVISYSKEIGKNMTLIKTEYGSIIFDCGAKIGDGDVEYISTSDFKAFLSENNVEISDVKALIVSHAHLDHYGSIIEIIDAGIPFDKIYVNYYTRKLISRVSHDIPDLGNMKPVSDFRDENIEIWSYRNGHILGSECYVINFDNINILYTGDFCLHDQAIVKGLNIDTLLDNPSIKKYGVDCLITETTYGLAKHHLAYADSVKALQYFVNKLLAIGYKIFIPSFALGRTQEIALSLSSENRIIIDGLAVDLSVEYENLLGDTKIINRNNIRSSTSKNVSLNIYNHNDVVLSSSGMIVENSTSANYMKEILKANEHIAVIKTGYISSESYGNTMLSKIVDNNILLDISLSAHAGRNDILKLISSLSPKNVVTIHGKGLSIFNTTTDIYETIATSTDSVVEEKFPNDNKIVFTVEETQLKNSIKEAIAQGERVLSKGANLNTFRAIYDKVFKYLKLYSPKYSEAIDICKELDNNYLEIHNYLKEHFIYE